MWLHNGQELVSSENLRRCPEVSGSKQRLYLDLLSLISLAPAVRQFPFAMQQCNPRETFNLIL